MQFRTLLLFVVLGITALFVALNWTALTTPTTLSLGVQTVQAPVGMVMLALMALLTVAFVVYALTLHGTALHDSRRQARELQSQRELADKAEASRFTELRNFMSAELLRVTQAEDAMRGQLLARIDALEQQSRLLMDQQANSLAASIGELEDRLERRVAAYDPRRGNGDGRPG